MEKILFYVFLQSKFAIGLAMVVRTLSLKTSLLVLCLLLGGGWATLKAQFAPPEAVLQSHTRSHPGQEVTWRPGPEGSTEAVSPSKSSSQVWVYSPKGQLLRTLEPVHLILLPGNVPNQLAANYPNAAPGQAYRAEVPGKKAFYEVELTEADQSFRLRFDQKGKAFGSVLPVMPSPPVVAQTTPMRGEEPSETTSDSLWEEDLEVIDDDIRDLFEEEEELEEEWETEEDSENWELLLEEDEEEDPELLEFQQEESGDEDSPEEEKENDEDDPQDPENPGQISINRNRW